MKDKICCFTGHRDIPATDYDRIQTKLELTLIPLIHNGVHTFYDGGARGFDMLAAMTVCKLRAQFPDVRLIWALPYKSESGAGEKIYDSILGAGDRIVYVSENYHGGCMHARNRYMVDHSGICVCYMTHAGGGTAYTVDYAAKKGLTIIPID